MRHHESVFRCSLSVAEWLLAAFYLGLYQQRSYPILSVGANFASLLYMVRWTIGDIAAVHQPCNKHVHAHVASAFLPPISFASCQTFPSRFLSSSRRKIVSIAMAPASITRTHGHC